MVLPDVTRAYICWAGGIPSPWHLEVGRICGLGGPFPVQQSERKRVSFPKEILLKSINKGFPIAICPC